MNKLVKLSLTAAVSIAALTSTANAADTLEEAFKNGKTKGQVKLQYFTKDYEGSATKDARILATGGNIGYVTDKFHNVNLGATFQTSHVLSTDDDSSKYAGDLDADGSVLSEAYAKYTLGKSYFKAGRQYISLPLVAGSGSRIFKQSFESYTVATKEIADTTIVAAHITKYQARTDGAGNEPKFEKIGSNGATTLYVKNSSIKNLTLQLSALNVEDDYLTSFVDAKYKFEADLKPYIAVQYYNTNYDTSSSESSSLAGIKAGINIKGLDLFAAYTEANDDNDVKHGLGSSSYKQYTSTTSTSGANAFKAGAQAYQVGVAYKFGALSTKVRYSDFDLPTNGSSIKTADLKETTFNFSYKFSGAFKGLSAAVDFTILDSAAANQQENDLRTKLIYSF